MIAVDVMGGDFAPKEIIYGAFLAAQNNVEIMLFGPEELVIKILESIDPNWNKYKIFITNTTEVVEMTDEPSSVIRKKLDSSLVRAVSSVKNGLCKAVVSAGNSGAIMVASLFILGRSEGILRPAIIGQLPVKNRKVVCLDLGANADCKPEYLLQFAQMGNYYAKNLLNIPVPRVALLSNGQEEGKGSILVKEAYSLLKKMDINFIGNVEPESVLAYCADVVVTDGFSGNILLKTMEACYESLGNTCFKEQGGALLAGVKGLVIIAHGNSSAKEIKNAIILAQKNSILEESVYACFEESISRIVI